jgi:ABC-2 type transport system permease protein
MKLFLRLLNLKIQQRMMYRYDFLLGFVFMAISFFVMIFLWKAIYQGREVMSGFSFDELITYFILMELFDNLAPIRVFRILKEDVKQGFISTYLLKPVNSLRYYCTEGISNSASRFLFYLLPFLVIYVSVKSFIAPVSILNLALTFLMSIIAIIMSILLYLLLGCSTFWIVENGNINWAFNFFLTFVAGRLIPIQFLPNWLSSFLSYTPFISLYNLPGSIYLGKLSMVEIGIQFLIQGTWIAVLTTALIIIWNRGINRLELVSG